MINNVVIVGRLCQDPSFLALQNGINICNLTLAVTRPFKDMNTGEYGVDFINVSLWYGISKIAYDYTSKGDTVGIKGRLISRQREVNGTKITTLELIGERIAFIQLKKNKDGLKLIEEAAIDNQNITSDDYDIIDE